MESVEVSAKTVDEAIDIALEDLGLKRSQVDIEVLTPGKPGLFGLGGEQARVRVTALVEPIRRPAEDGEEEPIPEELLGERASRRPVDNLTQRERDVLTLVGRGMSNKQIAWRLGISEKTVKAHLGSVFDRLGVHDRTQAALWAQRHGLG